MPMQGETEGLVGILEIWGDGWRAVVGWGANAEGRICSHQHAGIFSAQLSGTVRRVYSSATV
jgi:hypothetical protein